MLLKYSQYQRRSKLGANGKPHRGSVTGSRIPNKGKGYRKGKIVSSKRLNGHKTYVAKKEEEVSSRMTVDPLCDNSNDSGLGFDQVDYQPHHPTSFNNQYWNEEVRGIKRPRVDIKLESDNANDNFTFPQIITVQQPQRLFINKVRREVQPKSKIGGGKISGGKAGRSIGKRGCADGNSASLAKSRDGCVCLEIVSQPENQHRARYQTEGSRGAVKDTTGNSFPLVKLSGYGGSDPVVLQVYIGTDQGKVVPHMFYQACKVSGKNSTPCVEKKLPDGTVVIEIEFDPTKDNLVLCDCVGILKERNVDVEHRFPEEPTARSRKKSTRCRMVFRTTITLPSGQTEVLQVTSHPIACTQPPGIPEICKKSLSSCPVTGNVELFIIGKNFLKDTKVKFSEGDMSSQDYWECVVQPDKEFLNQSHLICTVPMYRCEDIKEPANVEVSIVSGGKSSDHVNFLYTPAGTFPSQLVPVLSPPQTTPPTTSSFFAVTQSLGSAGQTILQGVPERSGYNSPQKILLIQSNMDLSTSPIAPASLPDDKSLLKTESRVWMKEEMGVMPVQSVVPSVLPSPPALVQSSSPQDSMILGVSPASGADQSVVMSSASSLVQSPSAQDNLILGVDPLSGTVQTVVPAASSLVQSPTPQDNLILGVSSLSGGVQSIVPSVLPSASTLVQSPTSQDSLILGVSPVPSMVQSTSGSSSPTILQDSPVNQTSPLLGVSQASALLQVSELVHSASILQAPTAPSVLQSPPGVLRSPELSPVTMPTSPVLQNPVQSALSKSPVMDSMNQASSLIQNLVTQSNLVANQSLQNSDLIQSPSSQSMVNSSGIVSPIGHTHMSPTLESTPSLVQSPPTLVKSPGLVLSPGMVHAQSPPSEISPSNSIVHPSSVMNSSNLNPATLLGERTLSNAPTLIPVSTIAEAATILQNNPAICTNAMSNSGNLAMIETNTMVQTGLVNTVNMLGPNIRENTITNSNIVESATLLQEVSSNTSVARGLESATPGGAASAVADLSSGQLPSMATIEKFVSGTPLPALSVETYLSHIENKPKLNCSQNLISSFSNSAQQESPIAIKQLVVAAAAAVLETKPTEPTITYPGKNIDNLNREVIRHNPVLLPAAENPPSHITFQNQEFLQQQQANFQIIQRPQPTSQAFTAPLTSPPFSTPQMYEQPLFQRVAQTQEKLDNPKPPLAATQFPGGRLFEPSLFPPSTQPQEKHEAPKPLTSAAPGTKKCEEGIPVPHELTVMSENDLISYINPSCFDQV